MIRFLHRFVVTFCIFQLCFKRLDLCFILFLQLRHFQLEIRRWRRRCRRWTRRTWRRTFSSLDFQRIKFLLQFLDFRRLWFCKSKLTRVQLRLELVSLPQKRLNLFLVNCIDLFETLLQTFIVLVSKSEFVDRNIIRDRKNRCFLRNAGAHIDSPT